MMARYTILKLAAMSIATPALIAKYGQPDKGRHPYVGLVVFYTGTGAPQWCCTGTLISPNVVVTAGHVAELNGPARIWFDENVDTVTEYPLGGGNSYTGRAFTYPHWQRDFLLPDTGDVGVVVLDHPVSGFKRFASLPVDGQLDQLADQQNRVFTVVGYGRFQSLTPIKLSERVRLKVNVKSANLLQDGYHLYTSTNPKSTNGTPRSTNFGDSGGAIFADNHQLVAVNSFAPDENGASTSYRLDRTDVINWINSFVH